jgi:hypothetical protein
MKKLFMIAATHALAIPGFAQTGSEALLGASDGIYSYVPFIQGLCYVIAALIAIVGATSIYMAMQNLTATGFKANCHECGQLPLFCLHGYLLASVLWL